MNQARRRLIDQGLTELGLGDMLEIGGKNGEALAHDEAAVWKRVLNARIAKFLEPKCILETHPGKGISTMLYQRASPKSEVVNSAEATKNRIELIDIDPFGQPWDCVNQLSISVKAARCVLVSNGEAFAVRRNLRKAQRYPTEYFGKSMPSWILKELIPRLEELTSKRCEFFYAFPTTVRIVLASTALPANLWEGCPQWMWWLHKYV